MRTLVTFAALFLAVSFVQLGSGTLGPLDALAAAAAGFRTAEIGLLGSAHFAGFLVGCWATPILLGAVGHARGFAAMAALGAISALLHPIVVDPWAWAAFRVVTGFAVAGTYTIIEAWLQAKVTNETRGRVAGVYRIVDMAASVVSQGLIGVLDPTTYVAYNLVACSMCLCLLPLALTRAEAPSMPHPPRLHPLRTLRTSPLAAISVIVVGMTNSGFRMVGPVYALESGLAASGVAAFMAAGVAGGALSQWPMGWLSDRVDRRRVLVLLSALAGLVSLGIAAGLAPSGGGVYAASFLFGAVAFPLYSLAAAHANDHAAIEEIVELNAALMFFYAIGAIVSPLFAAELIDRYGPPALFLYVAIAHAFLVLFGLWRMTRRASPTDRRPHRYAPRTSFLLWRLIAPRR